MASNDALQIGTLLDHASELRKKSRSEGESVPAKSAPLILDAELLDRFNNGEEQAFLEIYDRFGPGIFRHLLLRTGSREIAEDLTSTIFLRTWEYVASNSRIQNVKAFLYRIAQNLLIDHWRKRSVSDISVDITTLIIEGHGGEENPVEIAADSVDVAILYEELATIRQEYRDILVWRYIDELSIVEIAKISGKSTAAVYVTIHRAVKTLKKKIDRRIHS
jgi:RNA polymerase sigma-70 factor (ECF subfamily)